MAVQRGNGGAAGEWRCSESWSFALVGLAELAGLWHDRSMRIGEFELRDPVPELRRPIAIAMLRPWIRRGKGRDAVAQHTPAALGRAGAGQACRAWQVLRLHEVSAADAHGQRSAGLHDSEHDHPLRARRRRRTATTCSCTYGSRTLSARYTAARSRTCCRTSTYGSTAGSAGCTIRCRTRGRCW